MQSIAIPLLVLWVLVVPGSFYLLLWRARAAIRGKGGNDEVAAETRFLWQDYTPQLYFWEVPPI